MLLLQLLLKIIKNYLNWDEIRQLKAEGVVIGAHSHTHEHLAEYTLEKLQKEIEKSNKIFLKEIWRNTKFVCFSLWGGG